MTRQAVGAAACAGVAFEQLIPALLIAQQMAKGDISCG